MACLKDALVGLDVRHGGASAPFPEPGVGPTYGPSWTARITHADLRLRLFPAEQRWEGEVCHRLRFFPGFSGELRLDACEHEITFVRTADGVDLSWQADGASLRVTLPADGSVKAVRIGFRGEKPRAGLYFVGPSPTHPARPWEAWTQLQDEDARFVFPCQDHPRVKHAWSIRLEAPAGFTLLSNGRCTAQGEDGGLVWSTWEQSEPTPAYLITAVAAELDVVVAEGAPVPVRYLGPAGSAEHMKVAMGETPEMIAHFGSLWGPFPWPRYDQVVVHEFVFGGMENTGCTTMTDLLLVDDRVGEHWPAAGLVAHELAHQWFGDLVTCQDWSQAWLNESFATFAEAVWWEHRYAADEALWYAWQQAHAYFGEDRGRYRRPITSYDFREPIDVFDHHLYEKGAVVLRTLRAEMGAEAFGAGVRRYLDHHRHGSVHTRSLQAALEEASGQNLDRFFAQWVHGAGHPVIEIELAEEDGLVTLTARQRQEGAQTAAAFHVVLDVEVQSQGGGVRALRLPLRERERTFVLPTDGAVRTIRVDPAFSVLAEIRLTGPLHWLTALVSDPSPAVAARAVRALVEMGTPPALLAARFALSGHPFWGVRAEAAEAIGRRKDAGASEALCGALVSESEPRAIVAIVSALGAFGRSAAHTAALGARLEAGLPTWHAEGAVLVALGQAGGADVADTLRAAIGRRSWGEIVASRAMLGLAHTEDESAVDRLIAESTPGSDDRLAAGAATALGVLGDRVPKLRGRCREAVERLAVDGGYRTRMAAVSALARLAVPESAEVLSVVHRSAADGRLRRAAYEALGAVRGGRSEGEVISALRARIEQVAADQGKVQEAFDRLRPPTF